MKKLYLLFLLLAAASGSFAQTRYLDEVFTNVTVTRDTFGQNYSYLINPTAPILQDLSMNVYEPAGDTATHRPVIVYLHTGSFLPLLINGTTTGDMSDSAVVEMCTRFARRGYVAIAMDYRLGWNPISTSQDDRTGSLLQAVYRALQDAKTCVRYLRMTEATMSNPYKIDPNRIILGGQGSGGYVALAYATLNNPNEILLAKFIAAGSSAIYQWSALGPYVDQSIWGGFDGLGGNASLNHDNWSGYSNSVNMVFNMGGALGDSTWLEAGDAPMVCFHVPTDPFAPYTSGQVIVPTTGQFVVYVTGSHDVVRLANQLGNNAAFAGPYNDVYTTRANLVNDGWEGLFPFLLPSPQAGPWEWWSLATLEAIAPLYGLTSGQVDVINSNSLLTNPDMSKTKAEAYIDSVQGYLAPRMYQAVVSGIKPVNLFEGNVNLYPNPAVESFTLQLDDASQRMEYIQLFDMTGRMVQQISNIHNSQVTVSREGLNSGMYLLKVKLNDKVVQGKLLIQ